MFSVVDGLDCRLAIWKCCLEIWFVERGASVMCVGGGESMGRLGLDRRPKGVGTCGLDQVVTQVGDLQISLLCSTPIASNDRIGIIPEITPWLRPLKCLGFAFENSQYPFLHFRIRRESIRVHHPSTTPATLEASLGVRCNDPPHFITGIIDSIRASPGCHSHSLP